MSGPPENDGEIFAKEKCESHDSTPTRVLFDNLGRPFVTIAHNGLDGLAQPILFETHVTLDIEGNPLKVRDALGIITEIDTFAPGGLQLKTESPDAGDRWALPNALGNPLRHWDSRSNVRRWTYDELNRPTHAYLKHSSDDEKLQTRTLYGESLGVTAPDLNHLSKVYRVYDSAGVLTSVEYDFKGNLLESERRLAEDYKGAPDWIDLAAETDPATIETAADSLLEAEVFTTSWTFDALGRPVTQTTPDASLTTQTFGSGGLLQSVAVNIRGAVDPTDIVTNIDYNARGQRTRIEYGNGSETDYEYDTKTFRVRRIHTVRPPHVDQQHVQDLHYHYDPSGNIAMIRDEAQQGVFFDNAYVDATQKFYYDPTYRLIKARGRELASLTLPTHEGFVSIPHPQSGTDTQRRYKEQYTYDAVGNITSLVHTSGGLDKWKRGYDYHPNSDDPPSPQINNRLRATSGASDLFEDPPNYTDVYTYDEHGNMTSMPSLALLTWDDDDRLQATLHGDGGKTYYVYDGGGQRVRKVRVNLAETTSKERLYFGPWEIYRERHNINTTPVLDLERETLHVYDDTGRVCLIETKTVDDGDPVIDPANITRYQYSNNLGTATLELDASAEIISYEEFHPYGTSSYSSTNSAIEVSPKRYRYTGQERDDETGLAYHGARYYACWLARWISSDPAGMIDGPCRYAYSRNNPVRLRDPGGMAASDEIDVDLAPTSRRRALEESGLEIDRDEARLDRVEEKINAEMEEALKGGGFGSDSYDRDRVNPLLDADANVAFARRDIASRRAGLASDYEALAADEAITARFNVTGNVVAGTAIVGAAALAIILAGPALASANAAYAHATVRGEQIAAAAVNVLQRAPSLEKPLRVALAAGLSFLQADTIANGGPGGGMSAKARPSRRLGNRTGLGGTSRSTPPSNFRAEGSSPQNTPVPILAEQADKARVAAEAARPRYEAAQKAYEEAGKEWFPLINEPSSPEKHAAGEAYGAAQRALNAAYKEYAFWLNEADELGRKVKPY